MSNLSLPPNKDFREDLYILKDLIEKRENFAFSRFSDGEVYMMLGTEIIMGPNGIKVGHEGSAKPCAKDDFKHFDPKEHDFFRLKMEEALIHRQNNYFKGLSCRCCIGGGGDRGQELFDWQLQKIGPGDEGNLTWSNLLINSNYLTFLKEVVPAIAQRKIVMVVNQAADLTDLGLPLVKDFRVGENCFINNYGLIDEIKIWIKDNNIKDHVFLIAASFLTNFINHQVYSIYPNNTFIDIGSSFNPFLKGIESRRAYMDQLYNNQEDTRKCIW